MRAGEVADPAVLLVEEADRGEGRAGAHVEPVGGAARHAQQVALLAEDGVHFAVHVQIEDAGAGDEEADLVIVVVRVLLEELRAGGLGLRRELRVVAGVQTEDVDGGEALLGVQLVDLRAVRGEHGLAVGVGRHVLADRPLLVAHADGASAAAISAGSEVRRTRVSGPDSDQVVSRVMGTTPGGGKESPDTETSIAGGRRGSEGEGGGGQRVSRDTSRRDSTACRA